MRRFSSFSTATLITACASPLGLAGTVGPSPIEQLQNQYIGARVFHAGAVTMFYGVPMTAGGTAQQANDAFLATHGDAFGVPGLELEALWSEPLDSGRLTAFGYRQRLGGLAVENSVVRVLVNNDLGPRVVLASARLANAPTLGLAAATVLPADALLSVQVNPQYAALPSWSAPELVVYAGEELELPAAPAWKFVADNDDRAHRVRWEFFVDASNGRLLFVRNGLNYTNVTGIVQGKGSPGTLPDIASNPPALLRIPEIKVYITSGGNSYTDRNGNFTITNNGVSNVTVNTNPTIGKWVSVHPSFGALLVTAGTFTPGVGGTLTMNPSPSEYLTAQVNSLIATDLTHNYFRDRGGPAGLDIAIGSYVNIGDWCNAYFDGTSINFLQAGNGCNNAAYSTINAHEYAHFVVKTLGLAQNAFGEGFSDATAMLAYDTPIVGEQFFQNGTNIRQPLVDNVQSPCTDEIHTCGEVLAASWYRTRLNMGAVYGSAQGLELTRQLQVDWTMITVGGPDATNAAGESTMIEILSVDDDDGNLYNGTPNYTSICSAFAAQNVGCPFLDLLAFSYPDGKPIGLSSTSATNFRVVVSGVPGTGGDPQPNTGQLHYSVNGADYITVQMPEGPTNTYTASLPPLPCGAVVKYYLTAWDMNGEVVSDPHYAPDYGNFSVISGSNSGVAFSDDFRTDKGWSYGVTGDTAVTGVWNRMQSQNRWGTQPVGGRSGTPDLCAVTDGNAGNTSGNFDVDNGFTTLMSPVVDLSAYSDAKISYYRWYSNDSGPNPYTQVMPIDISNDNGATWVNVETLGPGSPQAFDGWVYHEFLASQFIPLTGQMRLRFRAQDLLGCIVEAAVDDVQIIGWTCATGCPQPGCDGFDIAGNDCMLDLGDLSLLLSNYSRTGPSVAGDFNHDGVVDLSDLVALLAIYGRNCN